MENIFCPYCNSTIFANCNFCPDCGGKVSCRNCNTTIIKGSKFCIECGISLLEENTTSENNLNKIKFRETKDEREYEVTFTDKVAADVKNVVANMFSNKSIDFEEKNEPFERLVESIDVETTPNPIVDVNSGLGSQHFDFKDERSGNNDGLKEDNVSELPHFDDLKVKLEDSNITEKEWILVYSYYLSEFGKKTFTKNEAYVKYKKERGTKSRLNAFYKTWKLAYKDYFNTVNENALVINESGKKRAERILNFEIIPRTHKTNKTRNNAPSANKSVGVKNTKIEEFDLYEGGGLAQLIEKLNFTSAKDLIWSIAYYIKLTLKKDYFTDGNVDYAFKVLSLPNRPNNLRQTLTNIKNRDFIIDVAEEKNWTLNRTGEINFDKKLKEIDG